MVFVCLSPNPMLSPVLVTVWDEHSLWQCLEITNTCGTRISLGDLGGHALK